ncbi:MAG: hypothetical protein MK085_02870, partial [Phycisphaerales bacterium]|nr:hypothetical protein [Phycisphaerales bacterium]
GSFDNNGAFIATDRVNGHYVTVNEAVHVGNNRFISYRDPGGGAYDTVQSAFKSHQMDVVKQPFIWTDGTTLTGERLGNPWKNRSRMRMIDGYLSIAPKAGYTWGEHTPFKVMRFTPGMETWSPNHGTTTQTDTDGDVRIARSLPGDIELAILVENQIKLIDRLTGGISPLPPLPPGPIAAMDVDRFGRIHAAIDNILAIIDPSDGSIDRLELPGFVSSVATVHQFGASSSFRVPVIQALLPHEGLLATVMLTQQGHEVVYQSFTASIKMNSASRFFPMTGFAFLLTDGALQAFDTTSGLVPIDAGIPTFDHVRDVVIDDRNTLLLKMGDSRPYAAFHMDGQLHPLPEHPMNGMESQGGLTIVRSSSNERPWSRDDGQNVDSDEGMADEMEPLRECRADLNADGAVDGADLGLLLAEWGSGRSIADLNRDGAVDGADLGLLLGAYGACP